jgi:predicted Zn-dependent protease
MLFRQPNPFGGNTMGGGYGRPRFSKGRLILGLILAAFAYFSYLSSSEYNEILGVEQRIAMSKDQEIALGLQSAPEMADQYGGLDTNANDQAIVDTVGNKLIHQSVAAKTNWRFEFHLLADTKTVNAFALPGGQIFITRALYERLQSEDQLAGVIGHEIGHVIARHGAQHLAKQQLTQGLTGAAVVASGDQSVGQMAAMVGQMVNMRYGRDDELQSDEIGVRLMHEAGYDPHALIGVMEILAKAGGGKRQPEFFSTHPNPENRVEKIKAAIAKYQKS